MGALSTAQPLQIQYVQNFKEYAFWSIDVIKLIRQNPVLYIVSRLFPDTQASKTAEICMFEKIDEAARLNIVLNVGEEPATLIMRLVLSRATTTSLCEVFKSNY